MYKFIILVYNENEKIVRIVWVYLQKAFELTIYIMLWYELILNLDTIFGLNIFLFGNINRYKDNTHI